MSETIYRTRALERLQTPEKLDELLQVTDRKSWIPIATIAGGLLLVLVWSVVGRIPFNVGGTGILVFPRQVVSFQTPASGQLIELNIKVGDFLSKSQVIGRINQPNLLQRMEQERLRLAELETRNDRVVLLETRRNALQTDAIERKRALLEARIESSLRMARDQKEKNDEYMRNQRQSIETLRDTSKALSAALNKRYQAYQTLRDEGLSSSDALLSARETFIDNQIRASELELRAQELELKQLEAESRYLSQLDKVADLRFELQELDVQLAGVDQSLLETSTDRELEVQEIQRNIARYEQELRTKGQIVSDYSGRVLEVTAAVGQYVSSGQRLGALEAEDPERSLVAVTYFHVANGKRINLDMDVRITPTTVARERYGSIRGTVSSVSRFPVTTEAVTNVVGNAEVAGMLTGGGGKIEVFAVLRRDETTPSGYVWTSGRGPSGDVTAGTTVDARVTVEYRRPITFVLPILRRWSGID